MTEEGVIATKAIPNPEKLGYSANAFIMVRAELAKVDSICDQLSSYPEVHLVPRLMNDNDILFGVDSPTPETLFEFLKSKIANIDGILNTETFIRGNFLYFSADAMFLPSNGHPLGEKPAFIGGRFRN